tara:strand:+ start:315 stop:734 length:420 start_codon:yes stop_codon:yes gene_type:complete
MILKLNMSDKTLFIYDGECPFCNHFAQLIELKGSLPKLKILNGRENLDKLTQLYSQGYDLNKGAILITNGKIRHGSDAINWICSELKEPNDSLLELLRIIFSSNMRSKILFPFLLWGRRFALTVKGKVWQPVNQNTQFY